MFAIRSETVEDEVSHHPTQLWEVLALLGPVTQAGFSDSPVCRRCVIGADSLVLSAIKREFMCFLVTLWYLGCLIFTAAPLEFYLLTVYI